MSKRPTYDFDFFPLRNRLGAEGRKKTALYTNMRSKI